MVRRQAYFKTWKTCIHTEDYTNFESEAYRTVHIEMYTLIVSQSGRKVEANS